MDTIQGSNVMTMAEYMESRRKSIDRYVEGEHKWYGDLSTSMPSLSMYEGKLPWYLNDDTFPNTKGVNWGRTSIDVVGDGSSLC